MATVALGIAGNIILPGAGGFIGAFVGGLIDNYLLFPALFPSPSLQGPRLSDLSLQTAAEGSDMKVVLGPNNRTAGTIMWMSDLIEVATEQHQGKGMGGASQSSTTYSYYVDIAVHLADTSVIPVSRLRKVWADTKVIYDEDGPTDRYEELVFYDGTQTTADSLIESYKGAGNVPAYTGSAFVRIKRLFLGDFGNRPPNLSMWVEQAASLSVAQAIGLILERCGFLAAEYDTTRVSPCFKGQVIAGPQAGSDQLSPMMAAYSLVAQETGGKIHFFGRGDEPVVPVIEDHLSASDNGRIEFRKLQRQDTNDWEMPDEVAVRFISTDNDLQQGSVTKRRFEYTSNSSYSLDTQLTLSPVEATALAAQVLWAAEAERTKIEFSLPPHYLEIQEGDAIECTVDGVLTRVVVSELNRGANFLLRGSGYIGQTHVYDQFAEAQASEYSPANAYRPPETVGEFFDAPALVSDHLNRIGGYYAVCAVDPNAGWKGASVWRSPDGSTYAKLANAPTEAIIGVTLTGLRSGPTLFPDTENTVRVQLFEGTVESVSEDDWLSGRFVVAIQTRTGEFEIIAPRTVTVIDSALGIYELSNLIRGMRGTDHLVSKHRVSGARFISLRADSSIGFVDLGAGSLGRSDYYKFPAEEGLVADYTRQGPRTISGMTMRPFSPADLEAVFDAGTNDLNISWQRRSKAFASPYSAGGGGLSPDESPETYLVELRFGGIYAPIVRTKTVTAATSVTYTAAEQTTDGATPGSIGVFVTVTQVSQVVGRGLPATFAAFP